MPLPLLSATFLTHILRSKDPSDGSSSSPDQVDPEKGDSNGSGATQDEAFDGDSDDGGDAEQDGEELDDIDENGEIDMGEGAEDERRSGRGVPLTSTGTMSSISTSNFPRPSLPGWIVKTKDFLFGSQDGGSEDFLPNYRRAPLISGSLIPFSILLEIPGLTQPWYVRTYGHQTVEARPNPPWVIASMSISMALAVLANIALIYRFLERRVKRSTVICIIALTLHDILNIVTVVIFGIQHRFHDGFTNGEAFWMTICSTIVSSTTNLLLIWDLVRTPNFDKAGSGITRKQRSLVIITIIFFTYIALGALITSLAMSLTFVNGLYFTIVTTLTIGFGDIVPITPAQRFMVCFYAVFGIVILGASVRLAAEAVLEGLEVGYRRRLQEYRRRRRERKVEREQIRRWRVAVEERLVERGLEVWTPDKPTLPSPQLPNARPTPNRRGSSFVPQAMYLNTEALPPDALDSAAQEAGVPPEKFVGRKFGRRARQNPPHHHHHDHRQKQQQQGKGPGRVPMDFTWTIDDSGMHERKSGFQVGQWWDRACQTLRLASAGDGTSNSREHPNGSMPYQETIKVLARDERRSLYTKLGLAWALFFTFWTIGSLIFSATEGWKYGEAMYFCFIAFTTIGYGDLTPQTALGRGIFVFWALFGVGAMTILFAVIGDAFSSKYRSVTHDKKFDRAVHRYHEKATGRKAGERGGWRNSRCSAQVVPALQANLARVSSREPAQSCSAPLPALTLAEAEDRLRARIEPLPAMILREVLKIRDHTRYFLVANGHADVMNLQVGGENGPSTLKGPRVPDDLKELLDEIAQEEGFEERLKQEVWEDSHARNTLVLLSLERGARKMIEAAEVALETLTARNGLLVREEPEVEVEEPEEMCNEVE